MNTPRLLLPALLLVLPLGGCNHDRSEGSGLNSYVEDRSRYVGSRKLYRTSLSETNRAAREVVADMGLTITADALTGTTSRIVASGLVDEPVQWKNVSILCNRVTDDETTVDVTCERTRPPSDVAQTALTNDVFTRLSRKLERPR